MASSLIRGKHLLSPTTSGGGTTVLYDAAVYQEDGVIIAVGPWQTLRAQYQPDTELGGLDYAIIPVWLTPITTGAVLRRSKMGTCDDSLKCGFWPAGDAGPTTTT